MKKKTINKKLKELITEELGWYFLNQTGYRRINGGYANVVKLKIKKLKDTDNWYNVTGQLISGECDTGDGHSVQYTDEIEMNIKIEKNKIVDMKEIEGV
jgi:hypothetical protein